MIFIRLDDKLYQFLLHTIYLTHCFSLRHASISRISGKSKNVARSEKQLSAKDHLRNSYQILWNEWHYCPKRAVYKKKSGNNKSSYPIGMPLWTDRQPDHMGSNWKGNRCVGKNNQNKKTINTFKQPLTLIALLSFNDSSQGGSTCSGPQG